MFVVVNPPAMGRLSPGASTGWRRYCSEQGVTQTALAEALGRAMGRAVDGERLPSWQAIVADARQIAGERRER
jgi:hypothetical protein